MIVTVTLRVEVDPEAWALTYGTGGARNIREDVKVYAHSMIDGSAAASEGVITDVTVR